MLKKIILIFAIFSGVNTLYFSEMVAFSGESTENSPIVTRIHKKTLKKPIRIDVTTAKEDREKVAEFREVTLIATAYYSPLPDQKYYLKNNHKEELLLNGNGTHGASGKGVFNGMFAAPARYDFGTKIWVEGYGIGSVEDRGGAIVPAGFRGNAFDRIDIWMGYGEEGLARALAWGRRTVKARIYTNKSTEVTFDFQKIHPANLSKSIAKSAKTSPDLFAFAGSIEKPQAQVDELESKIQAFHKEKLRVQKIINAIGTPKVGEISHNIRLLQEILIEMGYLHSKSTAIYGVETKKAVAHFQKFNGLILELNDPHAGVLGEMTRVKLVDEVLYKGIDI